MPKVMSRASLTAIGKKENHHLFSLIDEHYYESTGWFMHNQDYYDAYDRTMPKVYLGEYAASTNVKRSNVETALA